MQQRNIPLLANIPLLVSVPGKFFKMGKVSDAAAKISVTFQDTSGATFANQFDAPRGMYYSPPNGFGGLIIQSDKDTNVIVYITDGSGGFDTQLDGSLVEVYNTADNPLYVSSQPGEFLKVELKPNDCDSAVIVKICEEKEIFSLSSILFDVLEVPSGSYGSEYIFSYSQNIYAYGKLYTVQRVIIRNTGLVPFTIEPTLDGESPTGNGAILLQPGEVYIDTDIPNATWWCYTDYLAGVSTANVEILVGR